jgi:hypothetical protein
MVVVLGNPSGIKGQTNTVNNRTLSKLRLTRKSQVPRKGRRCYQRNLPE